MMVLLCDVGNCRGGWGLGVGWRWWRAFLIPKILPPISIYFNTPFHDFLVKRLSIPPLYMQVVAFVLVYVITKNDVNYWHIH